jgi:pimeloyl-ACP methyl ester carboxylesterase
MKEATGIHDDYHETVVVQRTRWARGKEKLLYWGFSYGTVIGTTFAPLYPERVGRVILDGVVDSPDYYNCSALSAIQDSDKALDHLLQLCFESGSREKCGLYNPPGVEEIQTTLLSIMDSVKGNPFPAGLSGDRGSQLIIASDLDLALHMALYFPLESAAQLFQAMHNGYDYYGDLFVRH